MPQVRIAQQSFYNLAKIVSCPPGVDMSRPWFVMETFFTVDGPRTRRCDGSYKTEDECREAFKEKGITL